MNNLRLINETVITSNVSVIDITNVFNSDFDVYYVTVSDESDGTSGNNLSGRFIDEYGRVIASSVYKYAMNIGKSETSFQELASTSADKMLVQFGTGNDSAIGGTGAYNYIYNPFNGNRYTHVYGTHPAMSGSNGRIYNKIASLVLSNVITGFRIIGDDGDITNCTVTTYGVRADT